jgi:hypothetical protein
MYIAVRGYSWNTEPQLEGSPFWWRRKKRMRRGQPCGRRRR